MGRAASLLSYYVPANLAVKGLSSLNPTIGKFSKLATEAGYSQEDVKSHLAEKMEQSKEPAKSLFNQMLGGANPSSFPKQVQDQIQFIGMIADKFEGEGKTMESPEVKNLSKKLKNILKGKPGVAVEEIARFQGGQQGQPMGQPMQGMQPQQQAMQGQMGQAQGQQQGMGPGQQALMAILQKIQAQRGA